MFDWLTPEFRPFVGVFILAIVFVAVASLIHKYRLWQAEKLSKAQRLFAGAQHLEKALQAMEGLTLPQEVGDFCRSELLARYRAVQALFRRFDGIQQRIAEAEGRHPGRGGNWEPPRMETEAQVNRHTMALTGVLDAISSAPLYSNLDPATCRELRERIRVLRAETRFEFFGRSTLKAAQAGEWNKAQNDMLRLMGFLRQKAPPNDRGKELFNQATELYRHYNHRQIPGHEAADGGERDSRVA